MIVIVAIFNMKGTKEKRIRSLMELPLANEDFLTKNGSIWAQERCFDRIGIRNVSAYVENLASSLDVSVIAWWYNNNKSVSRLTPS